MKSASKITKSFSAAPRFLLMILTVGLPTVAVAQNWVPLVPPGERPAARNGSAGAYDDLTNRMIIFGGRANGPLVSDTWVLTNANGLEGGSRVWLQQLPEGPVPPGREEHSAVYDPASNRMIVFGGQTFLGLSNDVWVLTNANGLGDPGTWIQLHPSGIPPGSRSEHSAVYDSASNRMIIFGGYGVYPVVFDDVWLLTNANGQGGTPSWSQISPSGDGPSPYALSRAVYDSRTNRMILLQWVFSSPSENEVWVLTNANGLGGTPAWIELAPAGGVPSGRARPGLAFDGGTNRIVMFGGQDFGTFFNDVWVLTNANGLGETPGWIDVTPNSKGPAGRDMPVAGFDPETNRFILFGGQDYFFGFLNDVWVLRDANGITR